jgi:hypothetical protein
MVIVRCELALQFLLHRYSDDLLGRIGPIQIAWTAKINILGRF